MTRGICCLYVFWCLIIGIYPAFALEDNKLVALSKQIIEAKTNEDLYAPFEEIKDLYFSRDSGIPPAAGKDSKYTEFVDFLRSLSSKRKALGPFINYYIAFTRYSQLKHLEAKQLWDEYFAQGNTYRDEITTAAKNAIDATGPNDTLNVYARLILWQFHRDQQDTFAEDALSDLMKSVLTYSQSATNIGPIKVAADKLLSYDEKGKSKELYKIYVDKLVASNIKDEALAQSALAFYKEGGLELAESIYDVYIDRINKGLPKEKSIPVLIDIAKLFASKTEGPCDMFYAEKIFAKIQELGGEDIFNQELMYMRAFNLEKARDYNKAKDIYLDLAKRFPNSPYIDEADFKAAFLYTYILRDVKSGRSYFEELAKKEMVSPQVISSLYQLGLLSQWEDDFPKAKEYYNKLIEKVKDGFIDTVALTKERIKEIEEAKPIEYNLKTFLDSSLKEEYGVFDMTKLDLRAHPYKANKGEEIDINSTAYTGSSGCLQIQLQYLWSGHMGEAKPSIEQPSFNTSYESGGTKEINLVVVSPSGIIDRNIDLVDIN